MFDLFQFLIFVISICQVLTQGNQPYVISHNYLSLFNYSYIDKDECGKTYSSQNARIVGGTVANRKSWPASAYLVFNYKKTVNIDGDILTVESGSSCGGTLISRQNILTASHCLPTRITFVYNGFEYYTSVQPNSFYPTYASMFTVYLGLQDIKVVESGNISPGLKVLVAEAIRHEGYNERNFLNDIAILRLTKNVTLNEYIQTACLPKSQSNTYPGTNLPSWIVGWGTTSYGGSESNLLRNAKITIYDSSKCSSVLSTISKNWYSQICAGELSGGKDTCQGDSGGSLYSEQTYDGITKFYSVGIVSYGEGCGLVNKPGIYTRVSYYVDWINKVISAPTSTRSIYTTTRRSTTSRRRPFLFFF